MPWGYHLIAHIYQEGPISDQEMDDLIDNINDCAPNANFIGWHVEQVEEEPKDQIAS